MMAGTTSVCKKWVEYVSLAIRGRALPRRRSAGGSGRTIVDRKLTFTVDNVVPMAKCLYLASRLRRADPGRDRL